MESICDEFSHMIKTRFPAITDHTILSDHSLVIIDNMFRFMVMGGIAYSSASINYTKIHVASNDFPKPSGYDHIPVNIRKYLTSMNKIHSEVSFIINSRKYKVHIVCEGDSINITNMIRTNIKKMYIWLFVLSNISNYECSREVNIYLYLTPVKKTFTTANVILGQVHVNTAFTRSCQVNTDITIYREEEWFKTFIHETFHSFGLDFSAYDNSNISNNISKLFPDVTDVKLYESYAEVFAELTHIMFIEYFYTKRSVSYVDMYSKIPKMLKKIPQMIDKQLTFSCFQCSKIFRHYDMSYEDFYLNRGNKKYRENTPIFSYFVIKTLLLFHIDTCLIWCIRNNEYTLNFIRLMNGDTIENKMRRFYDDLIYSLYQSKSFIHVLSTICKFTNKIKITRNNKSLMNSLRMTIEDT